MTTFAVYFLLTAGYLALFFSVTTRRADRWGGAAVLGFSVVLFALGAPVLFQLSRWEIARRSTGDTSEAPIAALLFSAFVYGIGLCVAASVPFAAAVSMLVLNRHPKWLTTWVALRRWEKILISAGVPVAVATAVSGLAFLGHQ